MPHKSDHTKKFEKLEENIQLDGNLGVKTTIFPYHMCISTLDNYWTMVFLVKLTKWCQELGLTYDISRVRFIITVWNEGTIKKD